MPSKMVAAIKAIRTKGGAPVFRWGGDFAGVKDAMHFEVVASPHELSSGIDWSKAEVRAPNPSSPATWPVLQVGDRGPSVRVLQERLTDADCPCGPIDGIFGEGTEQAVRDFQSTRSLDVDGVVGLQTWTALLTSQGPTAPGRSPVKVARRAPMETVKLPATCKRSSKGKAVTQLQRRLNELGFACGKVDGIFGARTDAAVRDFQSKRGLEPDGIVGPKTWTALLAG
jgi:mannosyl-glycoprotein endo-beta-N-acetylglucosaminidase